MGNKDRDVGFNFIIQIRKLQDSSSPKIPFMSKIVFMIRILGTPAHKSKRTFAKMFLQNEFRHC